MRQALLPLTLLLLLSSLLATSVGQTADGSSGSRSSGSGALNYHDVNVTPRWLGAPNHTNTFGYPDRAVGGNDTYDLFASTRKPIEPGAERLHIELYGPCLGRDFGVRVTHGGQPVAGAEVSLYAQSGGRKKVSTVHTDAQGGAGFSDKPQGRYDVVAEKEPYAYGQEVFVIDTCAPAQTRADPPEAGDEGIEGVASWEQTLPSGAVRRFEPVRLADGAVGMRITLTLPAPDAGAGPNSSVVETIPPGIVESYAQVGFLDHYPDEISAQGPVELRWLLDGDVGGPFTRSYVIRRPMSPAMASNYGAPRLESPARPPGGGAGEQAAGGQGGAADAGGKKDDGAGILTLLAVGALLAVTLALMLRHLGGVMGGAEAGPEPSEEARTPAAADGAGTEKGEDAPPAPAAKA